MSYIPSLFVGLPLLSMLLGFFFHKNLKAAFLTTQFSTLLQFVGAFLFLALGGSDSSLTTSFGGWNSLYTIGFSLDSLSALLLCVSSLVVFSGCFFVYQEEQKESAGLVFPLVSALLLGINGAFLTQDLFNLFVFFEVLLIAAMVLIVRQGRIEHRRAAYFYLSMNFLASAMFLVGIGLIYQQVGGLSYEWIARYWSRVPEANQLLSFTFLMVCFATKAALFPFSFWLPKSYPPLTPAMGGIFGGLLTKVGLFAILKVGFVLFPEGQDYFQWLLWFSVLSMLVGVFCAYAQDEIRKILSHHIISQVGYIGGAIALAGMSPNPDVRATVVAAAVFYFCHHILVKSNLFFAGSWIQLSYQTTKLASLQALFHRHVVLSVLFAIPALSLAGLPPFSGFWAKLMVIQGALQVGVWVYVIAALLAGVFTFLSMLKIWNASFLGSEKKAPKSKEAVSVWSFVGAGLLALSTIFVSLFPGLLLEKCLEAAHIVLSHGGGQ